MFYDLHDLMANLRKFIVSWICASSLTLRAMERELHSPRLIEF
jgi:hypothetical protein